MNLKQIVVPTDSINPFISTLVQRGLVYLLGLAGAGAFFSTDDIAKIASGVIAFALMLYGAYRSYKSNEQKKIMETFVPDPIATTTAKVKSNEA